MKGFRACAAVAVALSASACGASFATRYEQGNANLSTGTGAAYLVIISPILRDALNHCIPYGAKDASPVIVIVADVDAAGTAQHLDIEPDSAGTDCVASQLGGRALPKPPLANGAPLFPIGLKIENHS